MTATPTAACAACYIGAASTVLHSFPYTVETITVEVIPQVTVVPHVTTVTNYDRETQTSHDSFLASALTTYSNSNAMTWTVGDATLSYPTTYVEYVGLRGATPQGTQTCAQSSNTFALATSSSAPQFYPLDTLDGSDDLPLELLGYLQSQPEISSQFAGHLLTACNALPRATTGAAAAATATQHLEADEDMIHPQPTIAPLQGLVDQAHVQKKKHKPAVVISVITGKPIVRTRKAA